MGTTDAELLSNMFGLHSEAYPNILLHSHVFSPEENTVLLDRNGIDVAIAELNASIHAEGWERLIDDELFIVVPEIHKLFNQSALSLYDIAGEDIAIFPPYFPGRIYMEKLFAGSGVYPHIYHEHSDPIQLLFYLERYGGISFFTKNFAYHMSTRSKKERELLKKFRLIAINRRDCRWEIGIRPAPDQIVSQNVQGFVAFAKSHYRDVESKRDIFIKTVSLF